MGKKIIFLKRNEMATAKNTSEVTPAEAKQLRDAFAKIDLNGDGKLSATELQTTLNSVLKIEKSEAEIKEMVNSSSFHSPTQSHSLPLSDKRV